MRGRALRGMIEKTADKWAPVHRMAGGGVFAFMDAQRTGWSARQRRSLEDQDYLGMSPTTPADCRASRTQPGAGRYNESASSAPRF